MHFNNDTELYRTIGANIKYYREQAKLTQVQLAEQVKISISYLSKIEAAGCNKSLSKRFKDYNVNTNFQIFLKIGDDKPFRPNHLRLLIDLKLRTRELPQTKETLLLTFDKIFYGTEPLDAIKPLTHIHFTQYINPIDITAILAQLFIIEQNIGYGGKSTFDPPSLYIQGWIRTFIESDQEIDQIVYRICRNTPPAVKYTCQDNKKHIKYNPNAQSLWYIT